MVMEGNKEKPETHGLGGKVRRKLISLRSPFSLQIDLQTPQPNKRFTLVSEPTAEQTPLPISVADMYFVPAIAGFLKAIIIIVGTILALLLLRKKL